MKRNAIAWAALVVSTAALVSSRGLTPRLPAAPSVPAESQKAARALSDAYIAVADFVKPSVVQINIQRKGSALRLPGGRGRGNNPFGPNGPNLNPKDLEEMLKKFLDPDSLPKFEREQFGPAAEGTGSGFVYDNKGHILTNYHVVENAAKITVTFHDGIDATATVVGTDPQSDVAVIKVENASYPALPKGSSAKLRVGELVMAVGSPFGLSQSVTQGIISATERNDVQINDYESFLQTDAAINPGNSGGPLVDMEGRVIGINSAIVTGGGGLGGRGGNDGVGFAIPIDLAGNVADKLIKDGKVSRARIGIALGALSPVLAKQLGLDPKTRGVLVNDIVPGSPAEKAGLKPGDVITGFNGQPVASVPNFRLTVAASDVGKSFDVVYYRDGKERTAQITPAPADKVVFEREREREPELSKEAEPVKTAIDDFGLEVQPLTADLAKSLGIPADTKGLLVSSVKEGSPAEAAGISTGNVITRVVRDQKIEAVKTVKDFLDLAGKTDELALYVQSGKGPSRFITLSKKKD